MAEKRKSSRILKRLKLRYGINTASSLAFSEDFSEFGIFIRAVNVVMPGSNLHIEVFLPDNQIVLFEGKVVWGRRVPGNLIHLMKKSGMGVVITRFLQNEDRYVAFCRSLAEKRKPLSKKSAQNTDSPAS